jgi:hypothetical protein
MQALTFWKIVAMDKSDFLEELISFFAQHGVHYCVIGGQAVNAYVDPVVSLDIDLVVAFERLDEVEKQLSQNFNLQRFPHSLNVSKAGSDIRAQIQTDPRYADFAARAAQREVLGMLLPVADLEDTLQGKVWAVLDAQRRSSKRQKDLADIARLLEAYPHLKPLVPQEILDRLI